MAARTSWNPRSERAPDYLDDDLSNPAYDDLLDAGFDEFGQLTRRRPDRGYHDDPRQEELRRAVDSLARQVDAAARQAGRARVPAPRASRPLDALDRLEARLDALNEDVRQRGGERQGRPDMARQFEAHSEAERARVEALMERHFAALDQRIAALHDLSRGKNVDGIRDELASLGDRIDGIASSGHSVSGSIELVREQVGELRHRLESEGWNGANALTAMQDRLELITDKLAQLELTPSALSAVERGYSHILERVSRIEQLAGQNVAADDLWDRLDALRDQIDGMQSNDGLTSLEARIAGLAENIETLSAQRGHDPAVDRVELKLADMARTIAIIRDRRDMHSGTIEARLADITARIEKIGQDRGRIDFTPVERQIAALTSRIDEIGRREPDFDVSGMERQFAELGGRIEEMLNRPVPVADDSPAFGTIEARLSELQSRLDDIHAAAGQSPAAAEPSEALTGIDRRLGELHGRLDDLTIASGVDPTDLTPIASRLDIIDERLNNVAESTASSLSVDLAGLSDKITMIDEQLRIMAPSNPELPVLLERLGAIESQIERSAGRTAEVDFGPLTKQLAALDQHLRDGRRSGEVDLQPVSTRLDGIETRLEDLMVSYPAETRSLTDRLEAIDRRFDDLAGAVAPDLSPLNDQLVEIDRQLRGLTQSGAGPALDWSPITDRLDAMDSRLANHQPGQAPDLADLREALAAIDDRLDRLGSTEPAAFAALGMDAASLDIAPLTERLQAIEERLSDINAAGNAGAAIDISPVTERLQAIEERLEALPAMAAAGAPDNDRLMPLLGTFEAALRKISTSDDIAALNDKVSGLHSALDSAGEGSALDEMADLRNDITYLRRELRSMPMMMESEDGSGGLGSILAEIKDRLDRIPAGQQVSDGSAGEGGAAIAAVVASIENSISELKQATAASDDDTRRALDALNMTMETVVGRMAYLETGVVAPVADMPVAEPAYPAEEELQYEPEMPHPDAGELSGEDDIPEISIGAQPLEQEFEAVEEETAAELHQVDDEPVAEAIEDALPAAEDVAGAQFYETPDHETPDHGGDIQAQAEGHREEHQYDTLEQQVYETADQAYDTPEHADTDQPAYDALAHEETPAAVEPEADDGEAIDAVAEDATAEDATVEDGAPALQHPADPASGSQSILGRLTSSQILKRATGGRAESFTPETEDQAEEGSSDTLLEPGTDSPINSSLRDAPSSDTALMSGEGAESRTRQGAGLGDLAAASGLGLDSLGDKEEQGNQFLSAARRAARAAVLEASQVDPGPSGNTRSVRKGTKSRNLKVLILALALAALLAFLGYKYWRGELSLEGLSIGGFSLTSSDPADGAGLLAALPDAVDRDAAAAGSGATAVPGSSASQEHVALEAITPDNSIAFGAPESASGLLQPGGTLSGFIASVGRNLPSSDRSATSDTDTGMSEMSPDTVGATASMPRPATPGEQAARSKKGDPMDRTEELVAAALAGAQARTASLPKAEPSTSILPNSIGSAGLRQAALADIPEAQFEIASRFADGSGVRSDMGSAAVWYEKAARKGLAPAQFRLGSLYEKGNGVPLDRARAAQLYQAAAETGNAKAMHNLAVLYADGGTGEPNLPAAAEWFRKAAEHGVRDSQFNIGILNARGLGIPQNSAEAYKWFAVAAKSGDEQAAKRRDTIAASMNQDELAKALTAANIFQPIPLIPDANLVAEPRGGWAAAAVEVSPSGAALIGRIQTLLTQRGFDPGPADGVIGRRTTGAIEAFQMEMGLAITGEPDLAVLSALETGAI